MSNDTSANDPMNFMKNMWGNMGFSLPGMVAPTFDVDELEKRVSDLKAVEGWLKMNLSMLQMTIQSLEMQCVTLNAVRTMGNMAAQQGAPEAPAAPPGEGGEAMAQAAQAAMWPWAMMQQMQEQLQQAAAAQTPPAEEKPAAPAKRAKKAQ